MDELARVSLQNDVGVITIKNPPVNALSSKMAQSLASAVLKLGANNTVGAIVVIGSGATFIAGADIRELARIGRGEAPPLDLLPSLQIIEDCPKPVIMAIHGAALGGGLEAAMCGHYRVSVPSAQFGMPEVKLGLIPGAGGTQRLPRLVGPVSAAHLCMNGRSIDAGAAEANGLLDRVVQGDLLDQAIRFAREVASRKFLKTRERDEKLASVDRDQMEALRSQIERERPQRAPLAALLAIQAAAELPFHAGCKLESELFNECLRSEESKALIYLFFAERTAAKIPKLRGVQKRYDIRKVAILGAGTMGAGIATAFAQSGIPVLLKEVSEDALGRGTAAIRANFERAVAKGRLTPEAAQALVTSVRTQTDFDGFNEVDLVVEAVYENLDIKRAVMAEVSKNLHPDCILATNTSSLDVDVIAAGCGRIEKTIGLHFFSPANVMRLVEVVPGAETEPDVTAACMSLAKRLGKVAVPSANHPGFIGNRAFRPYLREARFLVEEGATVEAVNEALVDFGMSMGPLTVEDLIGIDVSCHIEEQFRHLDPSGVRQSVLLETLLEQKQFGQKTGSGWSRYGPDRKPRPNPELGALAEKAAVSAGITRRVVDPEEVVDRCICGLINEGARLLGQGTAFRASDIDVVFVLGYGFPSWRGGPMFYADVIGLKNVLAKIQHLENRFGSELWAPASILRELAASGRQFADLDKRD
ncbi:MAG: 3-hydroxyacyl-CoA dehydrogenase NAD-binding domain-containing protein [Bryobacteraceae bacterium]